MGRRIKKVDSVASETTLYYHNNNWQVLDEYNGSGTHQRYYVYGHYIDEVLLMTDTTGENDVDHYYAHDHLYSPVALLEADGDVEERYEYDAYGKAVIYNDGFTQTYTTSQYDNPYYFTGRRLDQLDEDVSGDPQLEIMYYRNRYYDPINGRFLQNDPLGINPVRNEENPFFPDEQYDFGMNLYEYVNNRPVLYIDPIGLYGGATMPGVTGIPSGGGGGGGSGKKEADCACNPSSNKNRNQHNKCPQTQPKTIRSYSSSGTERITRRRYRDHLGNDWGQDYGQLVSEYHKGRRCFRGKGPYLSGSQCCYNPKGTLDDESCKMGTYDRAYGMENTGSHYSEDMEPYDKYAHCNDADTACGITKGLTKTY